jgi:hypothetical protein
VSTNYSALGSKNKAVIANAINTTPPIRVTETKEEKELMLTISQSFIWDLK